jgi:radical SAM-linked protein
MINLEPCPQRIRISYGKTQALRFTGNLDMQKTWERTIRRAKLPLAYSQGFHPQPKINQACPLPLGILSRAEVIDIWLENEIGFDELQDLLAQNSPPGISIYRVETIAMNAPALQTQVISAEYQARHLVDDQLNTITLAELTSRIIFLLSESAIRREWRGKSYDLRPLILNLESVIDDQNTDPLLSMHLSMREGATGRPEEVLSGLGINQYYARIERVKVVFKPG